MIALFYNYGTDYHRIMLTVRIHFFNLITATIKREWRNVEFLLRNPITPPIDLYLHNAVLLIDIVVYYFTCN